MLQLPDDKNLILTGFMGTGKSTVGRLVAERLSRPLVEMDELISAHFGKSIPEIFAQDGETAFRVYEAQLCQRLAQQRGLVISTGGGALVNPANRQALAQTGVVVCLTATVDAILGRVEGATDRPLLPGTAEEKRRRIRDLLHERRAAYAAIAHQVDTTGRTPEAIADQVLESLAADAEVAGMTRIPVAGPAGSYPICIGQGLLDAAGRLMANRGLGPGKAAIVTNPDIAAHLAQRLADALAAAGFEAHLCLLPEGEQHKTLANVAGLYPQWLAAGLDRRSPIVALGGGVIGDMAGFAAATYLRGVPLVQIPTSLLAMVDASVGGKTGVDLPQGKNLVGAFKQAELVIIDTGVLETLPAAEFRAGLAEVVKHGIIGAPDLFVQLEEHGPTSMAHLVADAVRVKVAVVEEDPFESGRRAVLNLGHTFGHAIEIVSGYRTRHGEGVAIGLAAATRLAARRELCDPALVRRVEGLLERLNLPTRAVGLSSEQIVAAMATDKKRSGSRLRFILPRAIGDVDVFDNVASEEVLAVL